MLPPGWILQQQESVPCVLQSLLQLLDSFTTLLAQMIRTLQLETPLMVADPAGTEPSDRHV